MSAFSEMALACLKLEFHIPAEFRKDWERVRDAAQKHALDQDRRQDALTATTRALSRLGSPRAW